MLIEFLLKNKMFVLVVVLLLACAGEYIYISLLTSKQDVLLAEKQTLTVQLEESQGNLKQLQFNIQAQNNAIDQLKKDAEIHSAKSAAEIKTAQAVAETHKLHAEELLKKIAPQDMSKCDAANLIINEEIKNAHK